MSAPATQDSTGLHPLLATLVARLEEAGTDDALVRAATHVRKWRSKGADDGERLGLSAEQMVEAAVISLSGGSHGEVFIGADLAERITGQAEHRLAIAEGLHEPLKSGDESVRSRAVEMATKALGVKNETPGSLRKMLEEGTRVDKVIIEAFARRKKQGKKTRAVISGLVPCTNCNSVRLPHANCPNCAAVPTITTDEQTAAAAQIDANGQIVAILASDDDDGEGVILSEAEAAVADGGVIAKGAGFDKPDEVVRSLQSRLYELGHGVDQHGKFDMPTEQAVLAFQEKMGLEPTGKVDALTVVMLRDPKPIKRDETAQATETAAKPKDGLMAPKDLNTELKKHGYDPADPVGSLRKIQRLYGLETTGSLDAKTQKLLRRLGGDAATEDPEEGTTVKDKDKKVEESATFDEVKHPRARGGKFREVSFHIEVGGKKQKVTGHDLGNGLAVVHRVNGASSLKEHQVKHIETGMGVGAIGDHGEDHGRVHEAMSVHFGGKDFKGKTVDQLRADSALKEKAGSLHKVRAAVGASPRREKLQARREFADKPLHKMDDDELARAHEIATESLNRTGSQEAKDRLMQIDAQRKTRGSSATHDAKGFRTDDTAKAAQQEYKDAFDAYEAIKKKKPSAAQLKAGRDRWDAAKNALRKLSESDEEFEALAEASFSSGGFDTDTPVAQDYGGINGLLPRNPAPFSGDDDMERTNGMDDFFGQSAPKRPPNLHEAPDLTFPRCATCVHHDGVRLCALYSAGTDKDDLCDSWFTLTPGAAQDSAMFYARVNASMQEAQASGKGSDVARLAPQARAALSKLEESIDETSLEFRSRLHVLTARGVSLTEAKVAAREDMVREVLDRVERGMPGIDLEEATGGEPKRACAECDRVQSALNEACVDCGHEFDAALVEVKSSAYPDLERKPGKQNWVDYAGGLPSYIERIAKHIHYENGKPIGTAIAMAVGTVRRWCAGGGVSAHSGASKANVGAGTKAKACAAIAEWEAKKKAGGAAQKAAGKLHEAALDPDVLAVLQAIQESEMLDIEPDDLTPEEALAIMAEVELHESTYPTTLHFDPRLHPRNRAGEFRDILSRLAKNGRGAEVTMPHGVSVHTRSGGRLTVRQGGRKIGTFHKPEEAATRALTATGIPDYKQVHHMGLQSERFAVAFDPGKMKNDEIAVKALAGDLTPRRGTNLAVVPGGHANTSTVYSYNEPLVHIDHNERAVHLNMHKYSATTSTHRNMVRRQAEQRGYSVREIDRAESLSRAGMDPDTPFTKLAAGVKLDPGSEKPGSWRQTQSGAVQTHRRTLPGGRGEALMKSPGRDSWLHLEHNSAGKVGKTREVSNEDAQVMLTTGAALERHRAAHAAVTGDKDDPGHLEWTGYGITGYVKPDTEENIRARIERLTKSQDEHHKKALRAIELRQSEATQRRHAMVAGNARMGILQAEHLLAQVRGEVPRTVRYGGEKADPGTTGPKERGNIVPGSTGSAFTPPGHPDQRYSVETDLRRKKENRSTLSLSSAVDAEWLDPATRSAAASKLKEYEQAKPPLEHPAVQEWVRSTLGYYANMHHDPSDTSGMSVKRGLDPMEHADTHMGVRMVRRYYPNYQPKPEDFAPGGYGQKAEAKWHHDVETTAALHSKLRNSDLVRMTDKPDVTIHRIKGEGLWQNATHVVRKGDQQKIAYSAEQAAGWARDPEGLGFDKGASMNWRTGQHYYNGEPTTNRPTDKFSYTGDNGDKQDPGDVRANTSFVGSYLHRDMGYELRRGKGVGGKTHAFVNGEHLGEFAGSQRATKAARDHIDARSSAPTRAEELRGDKADTGTDETALRPGETWPQHRRRMAKLHHDQGSPPARFSPAKLVTPPGSVEAFKTIEVGDRITIRTPHGQEQSGKAVMRGPHGWVANAGGRHGTPIIAHEGNVLKVRKAKKLSEVAAEVVLAVPSLRSDPNVATLLRTEEATFARLPLAKVIVTHGAKLPAALVEELREALLDTTPVEEIEEALQEATTAGDHAKQTLYEMLLEASRPAR